MKTTAKQFTGYGNTGLVQIMAIPESPIQVKPGGPEMKSGGLTISEVNASGVVGKLDAMNNTSFYLLLTDADVLIGAKQNRIINKSMLLAPHSKTIIDVSCIERLRWNYTSREFSNPGTAADHNLRKDKMTSMIREDSDNPGAAYRTQSKVWEHIRLSLTEEKFNEKTESYHEHASHRMKEKANELPHCEAEEGCNGLAVVVDGKVKCIDLFGTSELYRYYFPLLRDSAFRMASVIKDAKPADIHESNFRVLEALDTFETAERNTDALYDCVGKLAMAEKDGLIGFELTLDGQRVHEAIFGR
jgi:hypothetical protein